MDIVDQAKKCFRSSKNNSFFANEYYISNYYYYSFKNNKFYYLTHIWAEGIDSFLSKEYLWVSECNDSIGIRTRI